MRVVIPLLGARRRSRWLCGVVSEPRATAYRRSRRISPSRASSTFRKAETPDESILPEQIGGQLARAQTCISILGRLAVSYLHINPSSYSASAVECRCAPFRSNDFFEFRRCD
jgi:hypothetical protein